MRKTYLSLISIVLVFSSCTRYKNLVYLHPGESDTGVYKATPPEYHIQQRDVLYIRIMSLNQEITEVINSTGEINTNQFTNDASLFIYGYNVSDSGFVEIPVVGRVHVLGRTMEEARAEIADHAARYLKDATVTVKLISFKYSVMGAVKIPGVYQNYNNQLTVLEAISRAGDISDYGNRKKVMVIRPGNEGTTIYRHDLTKADILNSEGFFLLPNDIVYVEPVKSYNFRVNLPVIGTFLSAVSTLILVLNYVDKN